MSRARSKGTSLETAFTIYARENGFPDAHRNPLAGAKDVGDVNLRARYPAAIECKNTKSINLAQALREANVEAANIGPEAIGIAIIKKPRTTDVGEYYAVVDVETMLFLLKVAGY